jgi:hypothetical protein
MRTSTVRRGRAGGERGVIWYGVRTVLAGLLVALGCLSLPLAPAAWWVQDTVADTDTFVETLTPLAADPALQDYVTEEIVTQVTAAVERADVPGLLADGIERSVESVARDVVASDRFERAWVRALEELHPQLMALLREEPGSTPVAADGGDTVRVSIETLSDAIRDGLTDAGVPAAGLLPDIEITVPVATVEGLETAQTIYRPIDRWGALLAPLAVVLIAAGIAVAPGRRATALAAAAGGLLMFVLSLVAVGRLPADAREVGGTATALLVEPLRTTLWWLTLLAVIAAAALGVWSALARRRS